jgi:peptidoglycan/xylan/chitin deacetylase (PgdA/CDA1 family)
MTEITRTIAILGYHKIGEPSPQAWETWFYISESTFAQQMTTLKENAWKAVGLDEFYRGLEDPESLPEKSALITFDDGYRSILDPAVPILRRFGFPAVMFVPTDYVGSTNLFDGDDEPQEAICTWDELRQLERNGVAVQAHSVTHRAFSNLDEAEQEQELSGSKAALERALSRPVDAFAYPYGDDGGNRVAQRAVLRRTGYRAAFLYEGGPVRLPIRDSYQLPRLAMGEETDLLKELARVDSLT